jgi:glyoxylase-like metal-dependent hydrolase (beta-lactamase superfamily II)
VEDEDVVYFLIGDTSYTEQLLLEEQVDGVSPDEAVARQTIQKILRLAEECPLVYLPSHDPESLRRLENMETIRQFETAVW